VIDLIDVSVALYLGPVEPVLSLTVVIGVAGRRLDLVDNAGAVMAENPVDPAADFKDEPVGLDHMGHSDFLRIVAGP